ncbi:MAG: DUF421 domain-containing protein [Clostridia bacterium]|nr:DUF421 domain-containing protein [Clostridia bacterium]
MDIINLTLTAILSVAALFIIAKLMGHKQVAQLDFFDYISGITIGSIAAELATDLEAPWKSLVALCIYGIASVLLGQLTHKFPRMRKYINGTPTILMNGGKLYRKNLKQAKLDLSEFLLLCREQGYFDLDEIETAIFEHNGKLSVLPKSPNRPLTPSDMHITVKEAHIGTEVIMDGRIMGDNLHRLGRDENWLNKQLLAQGYEDARKIFLGIYHAEDKKLTLYPVD